MKQKPIIFSYNNFRTYLKDLYTFRNTLDPLFSKAFICKQLGLPNSRSYFQDVLNGKFVSSLKIPLFIRVFQLDKDEAQFFKVLVNYNQATGDQDDREALFEQLISLNRTPKTIISPQVYSYYKEWYHSVIRTVLSIIDFRKDGNYRTLARKIFPPITERQARSSVQLLSDLELVKENENGYLKPTDKVISTGTYAKDEIIKQYQLKAIEIAREAIVRDHGQPQRVITKTMSLSEESYSRIVKSLEKFSAEVNAIVHKDTRDSDRIYQLSLILYPQLNRGKHAGRK